MQRYLHELELMGYIKIVRGSRYKGFEYKINSWNDLESLTNDTRQMVKTIQETINSVTRNPTVTQASDGLPKVQKASKKKAVAQ